MLRHRTARLVPAVLIAGALLAGCGQGADTSTDPGALAPAPAAGAGSPASSGPERPDTGGQRFPDVLDATASRSGTTVTIDATLSSPYDTPERYADAFRARSADGQVYGVRELDHDHASEQPFTRSLTGVSLSAGVTEVIVEGRDQANGWGGATRTVPVPAS